MDVVCCTVLAMSTHRVRALYTNRCTTCHVVVVTNSHSSPVSGTSYSPMTALTMQSVAVAATSLPVGMAAGSTT